MPSKAAQTAVLVFRILSLIPLAFWYIPSFTRPHPKLSIGQALGRKLIFYILEFYSSLRTPPSVLRPPGPDPNSVTFDPAPLGLVKGPLDDPEIRPIATKGTWYPSKDSIKAYKPGTKVVLHWHGGGYVIGSAHPSESQLLADVLNKHVGAMCLFLEYRLSSLPGGRFPAAQLDALASYMYVLGLGVKPEDIILSGDSAGGNMVLAFLQYLQDYLKKEVPQPANALLWSPWIDVAAARNAANIAMNRNYPTDYLPEGFPTWAAATFAPEGVIDINSKYITLKPQNYTPTKTRLWFHVGGIEVLCDEILEYYDGLKRKGKVDCELYEDPYCYHDTLQTVRVNGFKKEVNAAAKAAGLFVARGKSQ